MEKDSLKWYAYSQTVEAIHYLRGLRIQVTSSHFDDLHGLIFNGASLLHATSGDQYKPELDEAVRSLTVALAVESRARATRDLTPVSYAEIEAAVIEEMDEIRRLRRYGGIEQQQQQQVQQQQVEEWEGQGPVSQYEWYSLELAFVCPRFPFC